MDGLKKVTSNEKNSSPIYWSYYLTLFVLQGQTTFGSVLFTRYLQEYSLKMLDTSRLGSTTMTVLLVLRGLREVLVPARPVRRSELRQKNRRQESYSDTG